LAFDGAATAEGIYRGMSELAREVGLKLVGGDTTAAPAHGSISLALLGSSDLRPKPRSAVAAGCAIAVTGELGGAEPDVPDTWRFSIDVAKSWEEVFFTSLTRSTRKISLRSAIVMSPNRVGTFDILLGLLRRGLGGASGTGEQFVSWIHYEDFIGTLGRMRRVPGVMRRHPRSDIRRQAYIVASRLARTSQGVYESEFGRATRRCDVSRATRREPSDCGAGCGETEELVDPSADLIAAV